MYCEAHAHCITWHRVWYKAQLFLDCWHFREKKRNYRNRELGLTRLNLMIYHSNYWLSWAYFTHDMINQIDSKVRHLLRTAYTSSFLGLVRTSSPTHAEHFDILFFFSLSKAKSNKNMISKYIYFWFDRNVMESIFYPK